MLGIREWGVGNRGQILCPYVATACLLSYYSLLPTSYSLSTGGAPLCR